MFADPLESNKVLVYRHLTIINLEPRMNKAAKLDVCCNQVAIVQMIKGTIVLLEGKR